MELENFISRFAEQFVDVEEINFNETTNFKEIPSWDSLTGMAVISMIEDDFKVKITDDELRDAQMIGDLINIIKSKRKE